MKVVQWSGKDNVPKLGERVKVRLSCPWARKGDGTGVVKNYIEDCGWLGVNLVKADGEEGIFYGLKIEHIKEET